jgi:hypothetical protein
MGSTVASLTTETAVVVLNLADGLVAASACIDLCLRCVTNMVRMDRSVKVQLRFVKALEGGGGNQSDKAPVFSPGNSANRRLAARPAGFSPALLVVAQ